MTGRTRCIATATLRLCLRDPSHVRPCLLYTSQAFGSDTRGFTSRLETSYAFSALGGRWLASANAQDRRGDAYEDSAHLGGVFRRSGYGIGTLHGSGAAVATLQYRRPLAQVLEYPCRLYTSRCV